MARIGPNGPVPLQAGSYEYADLNTRLTAALAGDEAGREARIGLALEAAKAPIGVLPPAPSFSVNPQITTDGTPQVGETITGSETFSGATAATRRWLRAGSPITGAVTNSYTLQAADNAGDPDIEYEVTLVGPGGTTTRKSAAIKVGVAPAPTPTVTMSAAIAKAEGNSGANVYTWTVERSSTVGAVAVPWTFEAGGTSANDFTGGAYPAGGNVNMADGVSSGTFSVSVNGDADVEPDEQFTVRISAPSGYQAGARMSATGAIINDDIGGPTPLYAPNLSRASSGQTIALAGNDGWRRLPSDLAPGAESRLAVNEFGQVVQKDGSDNPEAVKVPVMRDFDPGTGYTVALNVRRPEVGTRTIAKMASTTNGFDYRGIEMRLKPDGGWILVLPDVELLKDTSADADLLPDGEDVHIYHDVTNQTLEVIKSGGISLGTYNASGLRLSNGKVAGNVGFPAAVEANQSPTGHILGFPPKVWPGRYLGGSGAGNPSPAAFSAAPSIARQDGSSARPTAGIVVLLNSGTVDPATGTLATTELRRGAAVILTAPLPETYTLTSADEGRALRIVSLGQNPVGRITQASSNTVLVGGTGIPQPQRLMGEGPQGKTYFSSSRTDENTFEPATWEARIANVPASEADVTLTDDNYAFTAAGFPTTMALRDGRPLLNIVRRALNVTKKGTPMALTWSGDIDCNLNLPHGGTSTRSGNRFDFNHPSDPGTEGYAAFVITAIRSPITALDLREKAKADSPDAAVRNRKFNPKFVAEQSKFAIMRGMDLLNTNANWREQTWANRPTNPWKTRGNGAMTWEDLVALANLTLCDLHINVPWWSWANNNDYCRQLFAYLRDNLDSRLKLYIELQNEVWNNQFGVHLAIARWFRYGDPDSKGQNTVDGEVIKPADFSKVTFGDVIEGYAKRYEEVMTVAAEVFGSQMSRVVRVFGTTPIVEGDADRPKQFIRGALTARPAIKDKIDLVVAGTYFGYSVNPLALVDDVTKQIVPGTGVEHPDWTDDMAVLKTRTINSVNAVIEEILAFQSWLLATYGLKMGSYEGGQSHWDPIYNPSIMWRLSTANPPGQGEIVRPVYYTYHKHPLFVDVMELFWSRWINEVQAPICGFVDKGMMNKGPGEPANDGPFGMGWNDEDSLDPASPDFAPKRAGRQKVLDLNPRQEVTA